MFEMKSHILKVILLSLILFCVLSFISTVISLFPGIGHTDVLPTTNIGFPYKYYFQFWVRGNTGPNCGWSFNAFVIDVLFASGASAIFYFGIVKQKGTWR